MKKKSLARQAQERLEKEVVVLQRMYDGEHKDHQILKEQYALLKDNFETLARFKGHKLLGHLIKSFPQVVDSALKK